ncbi:hypothetical protein E2C01_102382 [Portunus trituberculatus]|uniref:Uncharacterized protein n=1 Tax=Portunus trituberculatus TaxID=210409 RepID=A0A5B7KP32_PORTR|nr:hypothetical protein [Portunus trituberculatus]
MHIHSLGGLVGGGVEVPEQPRSRPRVREGVGESGSDAAGVDFSDRLVTFANILRSRFLR